jgi:hypothetical protein
MLELLIAALISTAIFLGVLSVLLYASRHSLMEAYRYEATRILHQKLEEVSSMDYEELSGMLNMGSTSCEDALINGKNTVTRSLNGRKVKFGLFYSIEENPSLEIKLVTVVVCWKYRDKLHSLSGTTVVGKRR